MLYASKRRSYGIALLTPQAPSQLQWSARLLHGELAFSRWMWMGSEWERAKLSGQRGGSEHDAGRVGGALGENCWFGLEAQKKIKNAAGPFRRCGGLGGGGLVM